MRKIQILVVFFFFIFVATSFSTTFAQGFPEPAIVLFGPPENSRVQLEKGGFCYVQIGVLQNDHGLRGELWDITSGWKNGVRVYPEIPNFQQDPTKMLLGQYKPNVQLHGNHRYLVLVYFRGVCIKWWVFTTAPPLK